MVLSVVCIVGCTKEENNNESPSATDTTDSYEPWLETNDVKVASIYTAYRRFPYWSVSNSGDSSLIGGDYYNCYRTFEWQDNKLASVAWFFDDSVGYTDRYVYENNRLVKVVCDEIPDCYANISYQGNKISKVEKYWEGTLCMQMDFEYNGNQLCKETVRNTYNGDDVYVCYFEYDGNNIRSIALDNDGTGTHVKSFYITYENRTNPMKGIIMFTSLFANEGYDFPLMMYMVDMGCAINSDNVVSILLRDEDGDDVSNISWDYVGGLPHMGIVEERMDNNDIYSVDTVIYEYVR